MSSINNHHHNGGLGSSQTCELDQTLFVWGSYTASDNAPARKQGPATRDQWLQAFSTYHIYGKTFKWENFHSVNDFLLCYYYYLQTYLKPNMDYKHIREQLALQKQSTRRGLSKFLAKTRPSRVLAGNPDSAGSISCESC